MAMNDDVHIVPSVVKACLSLSSNADTNNDLRCFIRNSLPKSSKEEQLWWLKHHVKKAFHDGIIKNYKKTTPMKPSHLRNKWEDLLCDIYDENAAMKVAKRKKAYTRQRYICLCFCHIQH